MTNLIIDSHFLCHRAIHTMGALSYDDQNTGVIFGFLMQILSYAKEFETNNIIFCWDSQNSKRKELYPEYKNNRNKEELSEEEKELKEAGFKQFEILRDEVLPAMGFKNIYHQDGYEADDLIATTVMYHTEDFVIITADHDMYQLLDFADMWNPKVKEIYNYQNFLEEWGVYPEKWIEVKSLAGCGSDNIQGLKGIGEKTAVKYLKGLLKSTTKAHKNIEENKDWILKQNSVLVELPFPDTEINKIKKDELDFDKFIQEVCYRYSFDSFLNDNYYLKWENFFKGDF